MSRYDALASGKTAASQPVMTAVKLASFTSSFFDIPKSTR
jgi:hypothetical protein